MTQRARIEYGLHGGKCNSDAIDNSAGVNSSDVEVNIKIALKPAMDDGTLPRPKRNKLLAEMTETVAALVLDNNYHQTLAISLAEKRGLAILSLQQRLMEYLEERFPHPPLLPVYPVARAQSRLWMHRIEREWCPMLEQIRTGGKKEADKARKELRESLIGISPIFEDMPYFMSEEFTLVDCCLAPILWRLPELNIELPEKQVKPLLGYMSRVFEREAFKESLNEREKEMRA